MREAGSAADPFRCPHHKGRLRAVIPRPRRRVRGGPKPSPGAVMPGGTCMEAGCFCAGSSRFPEQSPPWAFAIPQREMQERGNSRCGSVLFRPSAPRESAADPRIRHQGLKRRPVFRAVPASRLLFADAAQTPDWDTRIPPSVRPPESQTSCTAPWAQSPSHPLHETWTP